MKIASHYVGIKSAPLEVAIDARWTMNFAASVDDDNPRYFDDTRVDGIVAPPMFAVALTWKLSRDAAAFWGGTDFPLEALQRQVHYLESLEWFLPLQPEDRLRIEGECIAVTPHRAGTLILFRYRARNQRGEQVFTELIGGLLRDVECVDKGSGVDAVPALPRASIEQPAWEQRIHISRLAAHQYDAGADIHFPIHTSRAFAQHVGLPDIIYHGTGTLARAVAALLNREGDGNPLRLRSAMCSFTGMVPLGSDITVQALGREAVEGGVRIQFQVITETGQKAIQSGAVIVSPAEV